MIGRSRSHLHPFAVPLAVAALLAACAAAPAAPSTTTTAPTLVRPPASTTTDPPPSTVPPFDTTAHSTTDPSSIWVIVNKTHPITPSDFRPELTIVRDYQVATAAAGALEAMLVAAEQAGHPLKIASAFRSYGYQQGVHARLVAERGQAAADMVSARPGHSEHQTGLAVDLQSWDDPHCALETCFGETPAGAWLAAHAWEHGFVVRYTAANQEATGYAPEPWHLRYVGPDLARHLHETGDPALEEVFGVRGGGYPTG